MKALLTVLTLLVGTVAVAAFTLMPVDQPDATEEGGKVGICHFDDHVGDFVTTGRGLGCNLQGGNVIIVSSMACDKGHKAEPRGDFDCYTDNLDLLEEDQVRGN